MAESLSITHKLWLEIDQKIAEVLPLAAEIKKISTAESGPWDTGEGRNLAIAKREAEKNKVAGVGRGLAIAIQLLTQPAFATADDVVKHAMLRHKAAKKGESIETPGIKGSGAEATAVVAREQKDAPADDPEPSPEPAAEPATSTPGTEEPATETSPVPTAEPPSTSAAPGPAAPRKRRATPPPTPEDTIGSSEKLDFDPDVAGPNTKMSVNEALARAAERVKAQRDAGQSGSLEPGHGEHTAEELAAMISGLDDE